MPAQVYLTLLLASCSSVASLDQTAARRWHMDTLRALSSVGRHPALENSVYLNIDGRALLERSSLSPEVKARGRKALQKHQNAIDELVRHRGRDGRIQGLAAALQRSEANMVRMFDKLARRDVTPLPSSPQMLLSDAFQSATGIDATEADAELFQIMSRHWGASPPAAALGVSAKFHTDGETEVARFHVALKLPCRSPPDGEKLISSARAAAAALRAPALVSAWVEAIGRADEAPASLGFGFARLGGGQRAGKIYVTNHVGQALPPLPVGDNYVLSDSVPRVGSSRDSQMVSLEWQLGGDHVVLRHYAMNHSLSHADRLRSFAGHGPLGDQLVSFMRAARGATETVGYSAPFLSSTGDAPQLVKSKVGLQLPDKYMADERFRLLVDPLLDSLGVDKAAVDEWISASSGVGHTVSNVQAGDGFVTFYRHPLDLCAHNEPAQAGPRRLADKTACDEAVEAFEEEMLSGLCTQAVLDTTTSNCTECINNNGYEKDATCWSECQADWSAGCPSACLDAHAALYSACQGCQPVHEWCGEPGANGLPAEFTGEACGQGEGAVCYDLYEVSPFWLLDNGYASAVFQKPFGDNDYLWLAEILGPEQCRYPFHPWATNFPVCKNCDSAWLMFEDSMLWGGPCNYMLQCAKEDMSDEESRACYEGMTCGCDCGEMLYRIDQSCQEGQDTCPETMPANCKVDNVDVHNACDALPFDSSWKQDMIWGGIISDSGCYRDRWAQQCWKDAPLETADGVRQWYRDALIEGDSPPDCCGTEIDPPEYQGQMNSSTGWLDTTNIDGAGNGAVWLSMWLARLLLVALQIA